MRRTFLALEISTEDKRRRQQPIRPKVSRAKDKSRPRRTPFFFYSGMGQYGSCGNMLEGKQQRAEGCFFADRVYAMILSKDCLCGRGAMRLVVCFPFFFWESQSLSFLSSFIRFAGGLTCERARGDLGEPVMSSFRIRFFGFGFSCRCAGCMGNWVAAEIRGTWCFDAVGPADDSGCAAFEGAAPVFSVSAPLVFFEREIGLF